MSQLTGKGPPSDRTKGSVGDTYTNVNTGTIYTLTDIHEIRTDRVHYYYTWVNPAPETEDISDLPIAEDSRF